MAISIPADLTIVTLKRNGQELAQRWTLAYATSVLREASDLLRSRTNIEFPRGASEQIVEEMPAGASADTVDEAFEGIRAGLEKYHMEVDPFLQAY